MKIFLLLLLLNTSFTFAQTIEESNLVKITYEYTHSISEKTAFDVQLYCNESHSQYIYYSEKRIIDLEDGLRYTFPSNNYITNYDFKNEKIEENRILSDGTILYANWNNEIDWEITEEEGYIGKYKVRKAITDSFESDPNHPFYAGKAIAWFCTDIPIPSGPARYYGLPGLILKLEYENDGGTYILKTIEGGDNYKFKEITKENTVDKEDVIYYKHKSLKKIKEIQKNSKKK